MSTALARLCLVACACLGMTATAQPLRGNRHTAELTEPLEREAIHALARYRFVQSFQVVCKRMSPAWADRAMEQERAWIFRNQNHLRVAVAVIEAIGEIIEKTQPIPGNGAYVAAVQRQAGSAAIDEASRRFDGASPANSMTPSGDRCLALFAGFVARELDFAETPGQTVHLRAYAQARFPDLSVR
ncbi:MAG: hypothetical protein ACK57B_04130 [Betaproteobacteria bacterium]|jgi:hypothetical protein